MLAFLGTNAANIIGQMLGFLAMGIMFMSFQTRKNKDLVAFQAVSALFWVLHYCFIGAFAGALSDGISSVRNFILIKRDKMSGKLVFALPFIFGVIYIGATVLTYDGLSSILPCIAAVSSTVVLLVPNERLLRILAIPATVAWIVYNVLSFSIAGVISESLNLISIVISLVRFTLRPASAIKSDKAETDEA